jgi:uncharacterized membrane protein YheB (UPF0754 family)
MVPDWRAHKMATDFKKAQIKQAQEALFELRPDDAQRVMHLAQRYMRKKAKAKISVSIDDDLLRRFDKVIEEGANRSAVIVALIALYIESAEKSKRAG